VTLIGAGDPVQFFVPTTTHRLVRRLANARPSGGYGSSSRRTRCCAGRRRTRPTRSCRGNDVPARPRPCRRRDPRHGDAPGPQAVPPPVHPLARLPGKRRRARLGVAGERSSTRTGTTPSSATGSSPIRSAPPVTRCRTGRCGGSVETWTGGPCSASPRPARPSSPRRRRCWPPARGSHPHSPEPRAAPRVPPLRAER
jgi:hypothetical protein